MSTTSSSHTPAEREKVGANPVFAIATAIFIAFLISGLGLLAFLRSDTLDTVRLIQQQSDAVISSSAGEVDTTSMPTKEEIEALKSDIQAAVDGLPPTSSIEEFSDQTLGL